MHEIPGYGENMFYNLSPSSFSYTFLLVLQEVCSSVRETSEPYLELLAPVKMG